MITVLNLCSGINIVNGATWLSAPIPLANLGQHCNLYLDLKVGAGTGTLTATERVSDGTTASDFVKPSHADATLCATHGKSTNTSGRDIYRFAAVPFIDSFVKIGLLAATSDASNVTAKLILWVEDSH